MADLMKYTVEGGREVKLSPAMIKHYICPNATEEECVMFMMMCRAHSLDPFIREAHLIKYGNEKATMVVSKDVFTKRAFRNPRFKGMESGVTVIDRNGNIERRKGSLVGETTEKLIGGWCSVHIDGYVAPIYDEVSVSEYAGKKKDGSLNKTWASKPATMIRKVAIVHALREAFPEDFGGLYDSAEMGIEAPSEQPVQVEAVEVQDEAYTAEHDAQMAEAQAQAEAEAYAQYQQEMYDEEVRF